MYFLLSYSFTFLQIWTTISGLFRPRSVRISSVSLSIWFDNIEQNITLNASLLLINIHKMIQRAVARGRGWQVTAARAGACVTSLAISCPSSSPSSLSFSSPIQYPLDRPSSVRPRRCLCLVDAGWWMLCCMPPPCSSNVPVPACFLCD